MPLSVQSLRNHIFIWKLFGLWYLNGEVRPMWYRVYGLCITIAFFVCFPLGMFIQLFQIDNIEEFVQTVMFFLTAMTGVKIWLVTVYHKPKVVHIFSLMDRLDKYTGEDVRDQKTIKKGVKRATFFNTFQFSLYFITSTVLYIDACMKSDRVLIWLYWLPFEYKQNEVVYQTVLFYQYLGTAFSGTMNSTIDSLSAGLYSVVESHLDLLGQRMANLGKNRREDQKINTPRYLEWQKSCEKELTECVLIHQLCVEFCNFTNDLLSTINIMQFGFTGISICAVTFQLSVLDLNDFPVEQKIVAPLAILLYFSCLIAQILIPSQSAGVVTANSARLPYFLFKCNWLEQRKQFKSSMFIFSERAKKPIIPMAGGLFEIGLPRFVAIMRAAYSMFACMKNLSDK